MTDDELYELYLRESAAYYRYVKAMRGDALVSTQRVSEKQVREKRDIWQELSNEIRPHLDQLRALLRAQGSEAAKAKRGS